jgi:carboxypeptidase C (cathepsin A)
MIYIDQPISVGFSFGHNHVDTTTSAAPLVWKLVQALYGQFPQYRSREFGIFTESYGGHFGPAFSKYILDQNDLIDQGTLAARKIKLTSLGINNGWIDPYNSYRSMIEFAGNNPYRTFIAKSRADSITSKLERLCLPALQECWREGSNSTCEDSLHTCRLNVETPLRKSGNFDIYDIRKGNAGKWPPPTYEKYLSQPEVQAAIGANSSYIECPKSVQSAFIKTGDGL